MKSVLRAAARAACSGPPLSRLITWRAKRTTGHVALTFDDGPDPVHTPRVLEILAEHGVPATFFLLGERVEHHADLVRRIAESGHEIGIHGWDHTLDDLPGQTARTRELLAALGIETELFRPPGGNLLPGAELWMVRQRLRTVLWSYDLLDSMRHEGKVSARAPLAEISAGDVILMHDDNPVCIDELPVICRYLVERELACVTVSRLYDA